MADAKNGPLGDLLGGDAVLLAPGAPCRCGPGFCATDHGLGFYGACRGPSTTGEAAPDCKLCGAPHQSPAGCWCCSVRSGNDPETAEIWVKALRAGVSGDEIFHEQGTADEFISLDEALERAITRKWS